VNIRQRCKDGRIWLLVALAALASSCYPGRAGFWPPVERLPELRPGVSTKSDVEALLGTPVGRGAARFTREMTRRQVWVYGYLGFDGRSTSTDEGQLMVFFAGDHYDGHFWTTKGRIPEPRREVNPP
jgi:hypothetical protein